ncbi:MlaD family protein [Pararhodobacter zhoushanensis]|uniref:MlaD family protein n=1 Tax=Pararhodobacter zhoushanensis TaxID=2479545 RepID=UPI000F8D7143|nr:MlaD family protein [Pararhodobacter zhoushanensis]
METKANYVLIGLFTIAGIVGLLGFFIWFAQVELDRQFAYYDVRFDSVSGLSNASDVRFSGLPVGQVVAVRLSPDNDGSITVRLEIAADTPVRTDSVATIESQGVTGVSYVGISAGTSTEPLLVPTARQSVPEITAGRSILQTLSEDGPQLVNETLRVVQGISALLSDDNQQRIQAILTNAETASEGLSTALQGFSGVAGTVDEFAQQINRFNTTLDTLTTSLTGVLSTADETLESITTLAARSTVLVDNGTVAVVSIEAAVAEAERYITEDLTPVTTTVRSTLADLNTQLATLSADADRLMTTFDTTGQTATARLEELQALFTRAETLMAGLETTAGSVTDVATRIDGLIESDAAPLLAETRVAVAEATQTIRSVNAVTQTQLPATIANVQAAVENARTVIADLGTTLTTAADGVGGVVTDARATLTQITTTFSDANQTLSAINSALAVGERTLAAAESTFTGADRFLNEDIDGLMTELRATVEGVNQAVGQVSADLPGISANLRAAGQSAADTFAQVQRLVDSSAPGVREFTTTGLPLYTRLAQETRELIDNIDQLTQQISRSPARFFLDQDVPTFRR